MGSGRKRPVDRSPTPTKAEEGRKKKKGKKSKQHKDSVSEPPHHKSSLESTATAEGKIMAQVYSTFNRLEQSRFEAFRRSTFPSDAISTYVAHCLIQEHVGHVPDANQREPILSELCAPGQAETISIVVSTLAKAYAQRLVAAARRLAQAPNEPIGPDHILEAFQERQAQGLDPGFFLQSNPSTRTTPRLVHKNDSHEQKRLAALQAQEEYDKLYPPKEDDPEEEEQTEKEEDKPMEIS